MIFQAFRAYLSPDNDLVYRDHKNIKTTNLDLSDCISLYNANFQQLYDLNFVGLRR